MTANFFWRGPSQGKNRISANATPRAMQISVPSEATMKMGIPRCSDSNCESNSNTVSTAKTNEKTAAACCAAALCADRGCVWSDDIYRVGEVVARRSSTGVERRTRVFSGVTSRLGEY